MKAGWQIIASLVGATNICRYDVAAMTNNAQTSVLIPNTSVVAVSEVASGSLKPVL
jgi:hypothetical protein